MRQKEKQISMLLYMPETLRNQLDVYMMDHFGRTYGRNEVINAALDEYINRAQDTTSKVDPSA
jgi:hypothetical protein